MHKLKLLFDALCTLLIPHVLLQVLVEYRNKDADHVEWAKAIKELYVPGLRDYVKSHYALGPVWNASGKPAGAPVKGPPGAPAPPPAPSASLFSAESSKPSSSSNQKQGMSAVFQQLSSGSVTSGKFEVDICLHMSVWNVNHK